ncbi:hydrogenase 4 subunit B [Uliginosibacterium sp. 31-16]|uniref:hydrogenase 4 subunit B n=1 Tax=Uliginosibacterium sp. 31-16 TaxID=3068315 RepID=UPI00273FFF18|nr:hydrogenase 4 subunit B [Uliginosibacterium sp. 31-16]MDP5240901.1 hydrogenase 4 subunit B [Uliginosibacterium sp. 31-16]
MNITPLGFLLISLTLYLAGAMASLLLPRREQLAIQASGVAGVLGGAAGLLAAWPTLLGGATQLFSADGPFPFAHFVVRLDPLAALMVFVISLLVLVCSLYSLAYVREYAGRGAWAMGIFTNIFVASMVALVVIDNAFYFLIFFEMMSLASYFLVIFDQDEEAVSAGFLYFLIAHAGSVLIMAAFFILYARSGSLDFESFRALHLTGPWASAVFLLAFFGFGAKAGMVPLHSWLPRAHPAAPSHASALMSGVMVKIGVFGIIKVGIDLLGATSSWWGMLVLAIGAVSAVLGVLYALAEKDLKRLLAYSTVENVGIILMGVGAGMIGIASHTPLLAAVGLLAGFYHLLNHAVFKGLLFLGAGSILYRTHTKDMDLLGGLATRMPWTAGAFLVGAMAICALPPLNGFVSEWFTYQALFSMGSASDLAVRLAGPVGMVMLAITGALAAACFVKAYGLSFSGLPRSAHADHAQEAPLPMVLAMLLLALAIVAFGVGAPLVTPVMAGVAASLVQGAVPAVAQGGSVFPGSAVQAVLSTPLLALLLLAVPVVPLLLVAGLKGVRLARRHAGDAWACGYAQEQAMTASSRGFVAQPLEAMFAPLYRLRELLDLVGPSKRGLQWSIDATARLEPVWDAKVVSRVVDLVQWLGGKVQWLQSGDFRIYCLYVVFTLVVLLLVVV